MKISTYHTLTAKELMKKIPQLANLSVSIIERVCLVQLKLPSLNMERKSLLNKRMKIDRLEFATRYSHWDVEQLKKVIFGDESHFELRLGN
jgi:hypothetical protein